MPVKPFFRRETVQAIITPMPLVQISNRLTKQQCAHVFYQSIMLFRSRCNDKQFDVTGGVSVDGQVNEVNGLVLQGKNIYGQ